MPMPGQMQLVQPMLRPAMAIAAPPGALIGGNLLRAPGLPGMPAGNCLLFFFSSPYSQHSKKFMESLSLLSTT